MFNLTGYKIHELLHQTSRTLVLRARRQRDDKPVILKRCGTDRPEPRDLALIRHEYELLRELEIPGVVRCFGCEGKGAGLTLICEDIGGTALRQQLNGPLPVEHCLELGLALASALGHLHEAGIIHKDINPGNIVRNPQTGEVQLIDFGIASRLPREVQSSQSPNLLEGTLLYLSPEQTGRTNRSIDYRSDFYALGMTLYELFTGQTAFVADDLLALVHSHIAKAPQPLVIINPQVPAVVSDIVLKLIAKAPEERYQSAAGLVHDLRRALVALRTEGRIAPFAIAERDVSQRLRIPQKLYGREAELETLGRALERASSGAAELLLLAGHAGVGKTALVQEAYKDLAVQGGVIIAGKFDLLNRNIPYSAIVQAFRGLIRPLLTESEQALSAWRTRIQRAVGRNGQVLVDLIPELEQLLGPQPSAPELGPTEAQNRFSLVLQEFVQVFTRPGHTLIMFLDDIQWADAASLRLIETLLRTPGAGHLLILLAYRDNELGELHPLGRTVDEARKSGIPVFEVHPAPLSLGHVQTLLAETLRRSEDEVAPLSQYVLKKTQGNPFFLNQFLMALYQQDLLRLDLATATWQWDLPRIAALQVTDNLVDFLLGKLRLLPEATQAALSLAACIGHQFTLSTLAAVSQDATGSPRAIADRLWAALEEGLLLPLDMSYRYVHSAEEIGAGGEVRYRFVHDRVQQAAYELLLEDERAALHVRVGRMLLGDSGAAPQDEKLFEAVDHLNQGVALIVEPAERLALARLNLAAGRRAKAATAYGAAAAYLAMGMRLLPEDSWTSEYALTFELSSSRIESEYLSGRSDAATPLFDSLLAHVRSKAEKAHAYGLRAALAFAAGDCPGALSAGRLGTELLGVKLPNTPEQVGAEIGAELGAIPGHMAGRHPDELLSAPPMSDADLLALTRILTALYAPAYVAEPTLFVLLAVKHVNLSLQHGNDKMSSFSYMMYGIILASMGRYAEAYDFGRFALALDKKINRSRDLVARLHNGYAASVAFPYESLHTCLNLLEEGRQAGLETGDFAYASYCSLNLPIMRLIIGQDLSHVADEAAELHALTQRTREAVAYSTIRVSQEFVNRLTSRFDDDDFMPNEADFVKSMESQRLYFALCWLALAKAQCFYLQERFDKALVACLQAEALVGYATGSIFKYEYAFYHALSLLALYSQLPAAERGPALAKVDELIAVIAAISACSSVNFRQKLFLLQAERSRVLSLDEKSREHEALSAYEQALDWAQKNEFPHDEALAAELAGRFHLAMGRRPLGRYYLSECYRAYQRFGATAKTSQLRSKYGSLLDISHGSGATTVTTQSATLSGEGLDIKSVLKAAQSLASEIRLDRLLSQMLRIVLENAGAERGLVLLSRNEKLLVEAAATAQSTDVTVLQALPPAACPDLCLAVVNYVARTGLPVVLSHAAESGEYASDPYIRRRRVKSLLCVPAQKGGKLVAMLYLENNLSEGCFTKDRIELLRVLSAQMAISIENANLYENLERKVSERTSQLEQAQARLLLLERETTERMLVGGFAHEVRNILAGPNMLLAQGLGSEGDGDSLPLKNAKRLKRIYALFADSADEEQLGELRDILRETFEDEERVEELLKLVSKAVERGLLLTRGLLNYARLGQETVRLEPLDLEKLVRGLCDELAAEFSQQDISLECTAAAGLPLIVGHAGGLHSMLLNLIGNARDAVLDGRLSQDRKRRIELRLEHGGGEVFCAVTDNGIGIPVENQERIFEPFFTTKMDTGTGLGLSLVRKIVNQHNGRILVDSEPLRGARFTIYFPAAPLS